MNDLINGKSRKYATAGTGSPLTSRCPSENSECTFLQNPDLRDGEILAHCPGFNGRSTDIRLSDKVRRRAVSARASGSVPLRRFALGLFQVLLQYGAFVGRADFQAASDQIDGFAGSACTQSQNGQIAAFAVRTGNQQR